MLTATKRPPIERQGRAPDLNSRDIGARVDEILCRRPAVGLAVGVVRDGRIAFFRAHGVADIASFKPVTEDTAFRIASITKTFTAIAVMQLWEQGRIDLDAPANEYLRAYRLVAAQPGDRPATVRHLLTHTAGIPETIHPWGVIRPDFGESVPAGLPLPTLAEYYRGEPAARGRARDPVHLRQPRVRDARPAGRGRHGAVPRGLPPRARLRALGDDGHRHRAIRIRQGPACNWLRDPPSRAATRRPPRDDHGRRGVDLLDAEGHGPLPRGAPGRRQQRARIRAPGDHLGQHVRASLPARSPDRGHGARVLPGHPRRTSRHRTPGHDAGLQLPDLPGAR